MINKKDKTEENYELAVADGECESKIQKLNHKLQATADELEEISRLYAQSVKEGLEKSFNFQKKSWWNKKSHQPDLKFDFILILVFIFYKLKYNASDFA